MTDSPTICPACGSNDIRFREKCGDWFCNACDYRWQLDELLKASASNRTKQLPSLFLSYARSDDVEPFDSARSFVARLHRDLTTAGFDIWFDRVDMPSRVLTF